MIKSILLKFKKDERGAGEIMIPFLLAVMTGMIVLFVFLQGLVVFTQQEEFDNSLKVGAELRAQKINNPMKEAFGIIEAMPTDQDGRENYEANYNLPLGYDYQDFGATSPQNIAYTNQLNQDTLKLVQEDLKANLGDNVKLQDGKFCISTVSLPEGMGDKVNVSCVIDGVTEDIDVYVDGLDHPAIKNGAFQITNAVFVGAVFEVKLTFEGIPLLLENINTVDLDTKTFEVDGYAIGYPHLETTTRK